jgi:acetoin utilization protein AcuB
VEPSGITLLVKSWMNPEVVWVEEKTAVIKVIELFKLRRLLFVPVLRKGKVVGLIGDRDVRDVSPSKTAVMDVRELHYLLSRMQAGDIMQPNPTTIRPEDTIEVAAIRMLDHNVTAIPVVEARGRLRGIITQGDVMKALISITGILHGGVQLAVTLSQSSEGIEKLTGAIKENGGRIISILGTKSAEEQETRQVFIRIMSMPEKDLKKLLSRLRKRFGVISVKKDPLQKKRHDRSGLPA